MRDHGYASSTPLADADGVYVFFGKSGVFAFDHDGQAALAGRRRLEHQGWGSAASPVPYKDPVFINAAVESDSLVALNHKTGKEVWRAGGMKEAWNTPMVVAADAGGAGIGRGDTWAKCWLRSAIRQIGMVLRHRHRLVHGA